MKILWLTEFYPGKNKESMIGGVPTRCYYVGNYLSRKNDLTVVEGVPKKWAKPSLQSFLVRLGYLPLEIIKGLQSEFDLIESSNFVMCFPSYIIARLKNKPLIFWYPDVFLGSWVKNVGIIGLVGELVERIMLFTGADYYIAISETVKEKLVKAGVSATRIFVVYCGVDLLQIGHVMRTKPKIKYDIVAVSRLVAYKRINDLILAVAVLKKTKATIKVGILGKGPELANLKELVVELGLQKTVEFVDFLPSHIDVLKFIASGKIFCHPSIVEGFGIANIEAMALGKPVVAANIPVINEVTQNGKGSLLFDPMNIPDLTLTLKKLLTNKLIYSQKKKEALRLSKMYDWQKIAKTTERVYQEVLNG